MFLQFLQTSLLDGWTGFSRERHGHNPAAAQGHAADIAGRISDELHIWREPPAAGELIGRRRSERNLAVMGMTRVQSDVAHEQRVLSLHFITPIHPGMRQEIRSGSRGA